MVDRQKTIRIVLKESEMGRERETLKNARGSTTDERVNYGGVAQGYCGTIVSPGPGKVWWSVSATLLILIFSLPLQTTGANHMRGAVKGACPADCLCLFLSFSLPLPVYHRKHLSMAKKERVNEKKE